MGPIKTTRKMCSPELMQQESKLLKVLTKVKRFEVDNDQLTLLDHQGKPQLRAQRVKSSI
jgi:heat shock protein HslJ